MPKQIIIILLLLLIGCTNQEKTLDFEKTFFEEKYWSAEKESEFLSLDITRQYQLILYGREFVHPPVLDFDRIFVSQNKGVLPFLEGKLLLAVNVSEIEIIITLAEKAHQQGILILDKHEKFTKLLKEKSALLTVTPAWLLNV